MSYILSACTAPLMDNCNQGLCGATDRAAFAHAHFSVFPHTVQCGGWPCITHCWHPVRMVMPCNALAQQCKQIELCSQGKIQGFGSSTGPDSKSSYSGIGSSNNFKSSSSSGATFGSGFVAPLGDGPIAQGVANVASAIGDFLGKNTGTRSSLNVSAAMHWCNVRLTRPAGATITANMPLQCILHA